MNKSVRTVYISQSAVSSNPDFTYQVQTCGLWLCFHPDTVVSDVRYNPAVRAVYLSHDFFRQVPRLTSVCKNRTYDGVVQTQLEVEGYDREDEDVDQSSHYQRDPSFCIVYLLDVSSEQGSEIFNNENIFQLFPQTDYWVPDCSFFFHIVHLY